VTLHVGGGARGKLAAQMSSEEAAHRLDVAGVEDPAEVVVDLEIGGTRRRRLVHRADHVRTATAATVSQPVNYRT